VKQSIALEPSSLRRSEWSISADVEASLLTRKILRENFLSWLFQCLSFYTLIIPTFTVGISNLEKYNISHFTTLT